MSKVIIFPGQGSQFRGMGKELFSQYRKQTQKASDILGYDIEELCVDDPKRVLSKTQFTQPALYVVNAFKYYEQKNKETPGYLMGHSLGEYNALLAAEAFDFETGLKIVQKRGELMGAASEGGMIAVLGLDASQIKQKLSARNFNDIDIANYNTPSQTVLSGPKNSIAEVVKDFDQQNIKIIPLMVTASFHSRYMETAAQEFVLFLQKFKFSPLKIPVISNVTAVPYQNNDIQNLLSKQIRSSVNWVDSIRFLMGKEITDYQEIGSNFLIKMVEEVRAKCTPIHVEEELNATDKIHTSNHEMILKDFVNNTQRSSDNQNFGMLLGNKRFKEDYGVAYAYVSGAMYRGIASKELVVRMGKAKMLGFLGTGGMSLEEIEGDIKYIQKELICGEAYGLNLLHNLDNTDIELNTVKLYIKYGIRNIEAAAFMQMTLPLTYYRVSGLKKDAHNTIICDHKIIAKVSRPEVAELFMSPAPKKFVAKLLNLGLITEEQAKLSETIPMSHDICVEADSGGHTDRGVALVLLPGMQSLRKDMQSKFSYKDAIRIGLAGGIGTPQAVSCAFVMGADFVLTGSINQCTVEAGTSDTVKDLLQDINIQDTGYAPAGDMFEIGAKVQVLKKGVLFSIRANKLYSLYQQYNSLDEIPEKTIAQLEKKYFKRSIKAIWDETKIYLESKGEHKIIKEAEKNQKKKMALVFRWYFGYSSKLSFDGDITEKVNFQIHTGPALGAFNQWVKGTELESWKNRHSDHIALKIMNEAAEIMKVNHLEEKTLV